MQLKAWRHVALGFAALGLVFGIAQLDRSMATPRSPRDRMLAALGQQGAGGGEPISGSAVAVYSTRQSLQQMAASMPAMATSVRPPRRLAKPLRGRAAEQATADLGTQSQVAPAAMPAPTHVFDGVANSDNNPQVLPSDATGDVGPNHYIQSVNVMFAIYNKSGQRLFGPQPNNFLWTNISDPCAATNDGDPTVMYDHLADRWIFSQPAWPNLAQNKGPFYQCFAISKTGDPLGAYWLYSFKLSDTEFNDAPKLGIWPDGYYMATSQFTIDSSGNFQWSGPAVFAFERDQMMKGGSAHWIGVNYNANAPWGGMLPADLDGPAPPAGTPNPFVEVDDGAFVPPDDALYLWAAQADWQNLVLTFGDNGIPNAVIPTEPFNLLPCALPATYTQACIPQKGTSQKIDSGGGFLMQRLQYRNYGDHESLVVNHTVDVGGGRAGVRWYEVRKSDTGPVIYQQGTYGPGAEHRWMGSAALDRQGNLAVGYSISSANMFPSIGYAGRLVSDAPGTLAQGEATMKAGTGSQTSTQARWGDYTMLAVDPSDDCTFWYTNQYLATTSLQSWRTSIGSFHFPSCTGAATGHLFGSVTRADNSQPIAGATVRAGGKTATTGAGGNFQIYNLPVGSYTLSVEAPGFQPKSVGGVAISDRQTSTANVALQPGGGGGSKIGYLPIVKRPLPPTATPTPRPPTPTPTQTPGCDPYEPNDNRAVNPFGPLASGQVYTAKLCQGDLEDNYFFVTSTSEQIQITLGLPSTLVGKTVLWIYDQNDLRQNQVLCADRTGLMVKPTTTILCSIPHPGGYVVRLYTDPETVFDNVNPYTLKVTYQ